MEIVTATYCETLKRYWRRRKYQRMYGVDNKRKIKVATLGDGREIRRRQWKIPSNKPKLMCLKRLLQPIKLVAKLHESYVNAMNRMGGSMAHKLTGAGAFAGGKVARTKQISTVSCGEELVDGKLVMEIYKRLVASKSNNNCIAY